eukprot:UN30548
MLRSPSKFTRIRNLSRVLMHLLEYGLSHVRDSLVGSATLRGISGGEKRRLSVLTELGSYTSFRCVELPTNGLDSATALRLVNMERRYADFFDTSYMCTIAQPSMELLSKFDNLLLLTKGNQIYFGPVEEAVDYFHKIGYVKPELKSAPDFLQELSSH